MPDILTLERYRDAIAAAAAALAERAETAGVESAVPTCPTWTVADLVAHQGMVHRWAAAILRQQDTARPNKTEILDSVPADELVAWFRAGAQELDQAFTSAPDDGKAMVFLDDAPPPREFWARRQTHETTIHSVDALAAKLGRMPTAADCDIPTDVALDGIDELLTGFYTRGRSKLADGTPFVVTVTPSDSDRGWTMVVGEERLTTTRDAADAADAADATFAGTAAQLYLGLWNRGDEITATGRREVLDRWREVQRIRWS